MGYRPENDLAARRADAQAARDPRLAKAPAGPVSEPIDWDRVEADWRAEVEAGWLAWWNDTHLVEYCDNPRQCYLEDGGCWH